MRRFLPLAIGLILLAAASPSIVRADPSHAPVGGCWSERAPLPRDVYGGAAASDGTYAYVAGGVSFNAFETLDTLYRFDPASNTWTELAPMPQAAFMTSAVYYPPTNKIYVFGGADAVSGTNYDTTRIYDTMTNSWTTGPPLPDVRSFMASAYDTFSTCMYLVGGYRTGDVSSAQNQTWSLCPGGSWISKAPIPHAVGGASSWFLNGHMYVAGGRDATGEVLDLCWDFDIAANSWSACDPLPYPINVAGSGTSSFGRRYLIG